MTATAFVDGIKKLPTLLAPQVEQLISLAPHMTEKERADTLKEMQAANTDIESNVKEITMIDDMAHKKSQEIYKKEFPKVKSAIQDAERAGAADILDKQINAA